MNNRGFTLIEVLIATVIFSVFMTALTFTNGNNMSDSLRMREELRLTALCEEKINDLVLEPPELRESITLVPIEKNFDNIVKGDERDNYQYKIIWKKFFFPIGKIVTAAQKKDEESGEDSGVVKGIQPSLLQKIQENVEQMIWQLTVEVKNKKTGYTFSLTTWVKNKDAKVEMSTI